MQQGQGADPVTGVNPASLATAPQEHLQRMLSLACKCVPGSPASSIQEAEAGGFPVVGQPELHNETLSQAHQHLIHLNTHTLHTPCAHIHTFTHIMYLYYKHTYTM